MTQPVAASDARVDGDEAPAASENSGAQNTAPMGPPAQGLKGPGFPIEDAEVTCPSCGRFAGTYERCPYCGANMRVRLSIKVLRRLCLVVAFLGVGLITWSAQNMEIPLGQVGDFTPTQNFAILKIHGKVVSGPYYGDRGDSFYVGVDDGTGRLNAKAYGATAVALAALDLGRGDQIAVQGSVRLQAGKAPSMSLRVKSDLAVLERAAPTAPAQATEIMKISDLTRNLAAERVKARVRGTVTKAWSNQAGHGALIEDSTGTLSLWIYERELARMGEGPEHLKQGAVVEATGRLDLYSRRGKETIQLRPFANSGGLLLIQAAPQTGLPQDPAPAPTPAATPSRAPAPVATTSAVPGPSVPESAAPALPIAPGIDDVGQPSPGLGGSAPVPEEPAVDSVSPEAETTAGAGQ